MTTAPQRTHNGLTNKPNRLEGRDPHVRIGLVVHESEEDLDELRPLSMRELDSGDGGDDLGRHSTNFRVGRPKGHHAVLLDLIARVVVQCKPSVRVVELSCAVLQPGSLQARGCGMIITHSCGESILQRKTGGVSDVLRRVLVDELCGEHHHVRRLLSVTES